MLYLINTKLANGIVYIINKPGLLLFINSNEISWLKLSVY